MRPVMSMKEISQIKKYGGSLVIQLDRGALKVYNLKEDSKIEIEYNYPEITIRKAPNDKQ